MLVDPQQSAIDEITRAGWIREVQWCDVVDSTNNVARHAANVETPTLIVANRQTAGRGRNARSWWSPNGCLMMTLVIDQTHLPEAVTQWSQLALVCGIAVANAASRFVNEVVQLKWPNDVYLRGRKLGGILIESAMGPGPHAGTRWLVGIGLNVDMDWTTAPPALAHSATCLSAVSGNKISREVVLVELARELAGCIESWQQQKMPWPALWAERCMLSGRVVHLRSGPDQEFVGLCEGIDANGRLIVRNESSVQFFAAGEVLAWQ